MIPGAAGATGKGGAPPPPDYRGAADAQGAASKEAVNQQTQQNRPDQYGPTGSVTWGTGPDGRPIQRTNIDPNLQGALTTAYGQVRDSLSKPFDLSGLPGIESGMAARDKAEGALYSRSTSRLDPQWTHDEDALRTRLANQGIDMNSEAASKELGNFGRAKNDAYEQARLGAQAYGGQEQQNQFGMSLANRQNSLSEILKQRTQPLGELGALSGMANPQFNSFMGAGQFQIPQYLAAALGQGNYGLEATQINNKAAGDFWSGATSAGMGAYAMSDEREKSDIRRLPIDAEPGIPVATFKYKRDPQQRRHVGVIAQDVEKKQPHNVVTGRDGRKRVHPKFRPFSLGAAA